ncbi:MAG: ATP-dependent DNA helicase RecG [Lachnospiraceae bacterium]|nr:ATP-dependent DNA helicase RecG [Lachnospiraceae bacterium]
MDITASLRQVKGVGEKTEQLFQKLGVYTVGDILLHFPRTYEEFPQIGSVTEDMQGKSMAFVGRLKTPALTRKGKRMEVTIATAFCDETPVECVWFRMPYLSKQLVVSEPIVFYGVLQQEGRKYKMEQPMCMSVEKYQALRQSFQPVYPLTKGLNNATVRKVLHTIFEDMDPEEDMLLPANICARERFPSYWIALQMLHFPNNFDELILGRRRLVYQEFFYYILHGFLQEAKEGSVTNPWHFSDTQRVEEVVAGLPFTLTKGQMETLHQIQKDLRGPWVTQRLIQGDVGSGKTIVAFLAMLDAIDNGYQAAIMAPTEVLARQHYESFLSLCETFSLPYPVVCLTGSMSAKERREAYACIADNSQVFIVGTHALIQDKVNYQKLALVITDEQHRFGVKQRERLAQKGGQPHMLVMSATPIPRTLAMILYNNMQISTIKDMPADRLPIKTCVIKENLRKKAYEMIAGQIKKGHQAYIICPLVEASDKTEAENVTDYVEKLRCYFEANVSVGMLHGKMPSAQKNEIMNAFETGEISILVSTTVVEVGVNIPNATVIMIENANRFGLAQLHQLRGRVGRGKWQSYCILMDQGNGEKITERLEVMNRSNDGFYIAGEDLRLRGPGDFFGIRQSGDLNFRIADIIGDADVLQQASVDVHRFLEDEANLDHYPQIKAHMARFEEENRLVL